jgi:hypothetical protein
MKKYLDFKENNLINESVIYFSPKIRDVLKLINNKISKELLDTEGVDIKPDITFVDLEKDGGVSFTTMKDAWNKLSETYPHLDYITKEVEDKEKRIEVADKMWKYDSSNIYTKSRNPSKIGRLVNKILPNKFTQKEIEDFTNQFKNATGSNAEFKIVSGDEIAHWYNVDNYKEDKGQLGNSCMKKKPDYYFQIYTKNPQVCQLVILVQNNRLLGRALLWKIKSSSKEEYGEGTYFLDRQYCINDSDVIKFREYAKENKWIWRESEIERVKDGSGSSFYIKMKVQLEETENGDYYYDYYPYVDTFRRYNPMTGILHNDDSEDSEYEGHLLLDDTGGGSREIEGGVWSEWEGRNIPHGDEVWSDYVDSYITAEYAVYVENGRRSNKGYYPQDHDDIVFDEISDYYLHVDDSVYSTHYGHSIDIEKSVTVIYDVDYDGAPIIEDFFHEDDNELVYQSKYRDTLWFKKLTEKWSDWDDYYYTTSDNFIENYEGELILRVFKVEAYKTKNSEIEYLSKLDSELLEIEIEGDTIIMDKFEYYSDKKGVSRRLLKLSKSMVRKIELEIAGKGQIKIPFEEDDRVKWSLESRRSNKISDVRDKIKDLESKLFFI